MAVAASIICLLLVAGLVFAEAKERSLWKAATKIPASLAFIAAAIFNGGLGGGTASQLVVVGLVLGAVGDAALLSNETKPFMLGIGAFLLSHVAYVAAFVALDVSWAAAAASLVVFVPIAIGIRRWIGDKAGELGGPVTAYVVVITVMVACSVGSLGHDVSTKRMVLLAAAILFFVSDICVARDRFVKPGFDNRLIGLPLYYVAQLLFAWSLAISVEHP